MPCRRQAGRTPRSRTHPSSAATSVPARQTAMPTTSRRRACSAERGWCARGPGRGPPQGSGRRGSRRARSAGGSARRRRRPGGCATGPRRRRPARRCARGSPGASAGRAVARAGRGGAPAGAGPAVNPRVANHAVRRRRRRAGPSGSAPPRCCGRPGQRRRLRSPASTREAPTASRVQDPGREPVAGRRGMDLSLEVDGHLGGVRIEVDRGAGVGQQRCGAHPGCSTTIASPGSSSMSQRSRRSSCRTGLA
jgi:hypothetical protein